MNSIQISIFTPKCVYFYPQNGGRVPVDPPLNWNKNSMINLTDKAAEKAAPKGDVGANDPNDLATHGKLKQVLSMGAFSFSDKEKAALEKILKD